MKIAVNRAGEAMPFFRLLLFSSHMVTCLILMEDHFPAFMAAFMAAFFFIASGRCLRMCSL